MEHTDFLIIGAGAAGMTAALYGARSGLRTLVIDEAGSGGQALQITQLENYPGVFPAVSGAQLFDAMQAQAAAFGARTLQTRASSVDKKDGRFLVRTGGGDISAAAVLLATGADHRHLGVPGEQEFFGRGVSYCAVCDGPFFRNKRIAVVGGGDSACSEALYLAELASHVTLVHRRGELRAQKVLADRIFAHPKISVRFHSTVQEIRGGATPEDAEVVRSVALRSTADGSEEQLEADAVFIFVGMKPRTELFEFIRTDAAGYVLTDESMATDVPGLFCAGDVRAKPLRQIVTAAADGAVAAYSAEKYVNGLPAAQRTGAAE
ncbi:MAG: thioredoxin-disulfide reductase [Treponemataceae bacterium]|nr:thioredoxin-disulfide reductase [Treponemataceae bacterium]